MGQRRRGEKPLLNVARMAARQKVIRSVEVLNITAKLESVGQRSGGEVKIKACKHCQSTQHTSLACFKAPRKPLKVKKVKVSTVKKKKPKTRSYYVKQLDKVFSEYIRRRDDGKGCVTCGIKKPWQEMQACHYYSRGKYPTRWHELNVHSGCYRCNVLLKGAYTDYALFMFSTYGAEKVQELYDLAHSGEKITTPVIREKIEEYRIKLLQY